MPSTGPFSGSSGQLKSSHSQGTVAYSRLRSAPSHFSSRQFFALKYGVSAILSRAQSTTDIFFVAVAPGATKSKVNVLMPSGPKMLAILNPPRSVQRPIGNVPLPMSPTRPLMSMESACTWKHAAAMASLVHLSSIRHHRSFASGRASDDSLEPSVTYLCGEDTIS
jgi:hypothetical protein